MSDELTVAYLKGYQDGKDAAMPSGKEADVVTRTFEEDASTPPLHMAAVMSGGDPNWLDDALDSVDFEVLHLEITHSAPREYGAEIYDHGGNPGFTGYGPTRREAILDAVKKAKEASDGH